MMKEFNTTGSCNPQRHYMVDTEKRFRAVKNLIDNGKYFTINRARQYGKTTMLQTIWRRMSDHYLIIKTSFEGVGDDSFKDEERFVKMFAGRMLNELRYDLAEEQYLSVWKRETLVSFDALGQAITEFCQNYPKQVVLLIDEVDKSSDNQTFIGFISL